MTFGFLTAKAYGLAIWVERFYRDALSLYIGFILLLFHFCTTVREYQQFKSCSKYCIFRDQFQSSNCRICRLYACKSESWIYEFVYLKCQYGEEKYSCSARGWILLKACFESSVKMYCIWRIIGTKNHTLGIQKLGMTMKEIGKDAGLLKKYKNHSVKAITVKL